MSLNMDRVGARDYAQFPRDLSCTPISPLQFQPGILPVTNGPRSKYETGEESIQRKQPCPLEASSKLRSECCKGRLSDQRACLSQREALSFAFLFDWPSTFDPCFLLFQIQPLFFQLLFHFAMASKDLSFSCTFCWKTIFISVSILASFCSCNVRSSSCLTAGLTSLKTLGSWLTPI